MKSNQKELFIIDIGNTNTKYGLYQNNCFSYIRYIKTKLVKNFILSLVERNCKIAISCVIPKIFEQLKDYNKKIFWVDHAKKLSFDLSLVKFEELGADRIANLESLSRVKKLPAMIIDCGTAITIEVLDEKKIFLGGIIGPGRYLIRKSLNLYTKLLPIVPIHNSYFYDKKLKVDNQIDISFGRDTIDSIILGSDVGIVGAIKEYIYITKKMLNIDDIDIYLTGGDSDIIANHIDGINVLSESFTLMGIYYIWENNNKI